MASRRVSVQGQHVAGVGGDGELYGVISMRSEGGVGLVHRRTPCATCPWRRDAEIGRFPAEAFRHSASTAYDMAESTFGCHEIGSERPATCAGFLLRGADHNLRIRLAMMTGRYDPADVNDAGVSLYDDYRAMAVANGVDPNDEALRSCR